MVRAFFQSILRLHLDVEMRGLHAAKENSTSEVCISEMVGRSGAIRWRSLVFFLGGSRVPSSGLQHISKAHQLSGDIAELLHKKLQKAVAVGCCGDFHPGTKFLTHADHGDVSFRFQMEEPGSHLSVSRTARHRKCQATDRHNRDTAQSQLE